MFVQLNIGSLLIKKYGISNYYLVLTVIIQNKICLFKGKLIFQYWIRGWIHLWFNVYQPSASRLGDKTFFCAHSSSVISIYIFSFIYLKNSLKYAAFIINFWHPFFVQSLLKKLEQFQQPIYCWNNSNFCIQALILYFLITYLN